MVPGSTTVRHICAALRNQVASQVPSNKVAIQLKRTIPIIQIPRYDGSGVGMTE
jgi:hypothetical protein